MPQYFQRELRAKGAPIDLLAALPKIGPPTPSNFEDQIRGRFDEIDSIGTQQTAFAEQQAAAKQRARAAAMQNMLKNGYSSSGASAPSNGKFWINPVQGYKPSFEYGRYPSGGVHNAFDFAVPLNTQVYAPFSGKVVTAGSEKGGFGNALRVQFDDGTYGIFGHLASMALKAGDIFTAGQLLAMSGNTGRSTGPHLHFETRRSLYDPNSAFNPSHLFGW